MNGPGFKLGMKQECWHYPQCCTDSYCPSIHATRDWLQMGGARLDTGYPFGSGHDEPCKNSTPSDSLVNGGRAFCDADGINIGIKQSGLKRSDIFVVMKSGSAGPMGPFAPIGPPCHKESNVAVSSGIGARYQACMMMK